MELQEYQKKIIQLYLEQELAIASLYERYSKRYLAHQEFWAEMRAEELEHAAWVKHFMGHALENKIHFSEGKTRTYALSSSIAYIEGVISDFDNKPFDSSRAASVALDLERSLLEKNVFSCFHGDSAEAKSILEALIAGQITHIKKLEAFVDRIRKLHR
jgi:hypothetical protein